MLPELAKAISNELYPEGSEENRYGEISEASSLPEIAQEYKSTFKREALDKLLKRLVRDEDFTPGETHERLLRFPWRDIFTTNWDTLLERTYVSVPDRSYRVIRRVDEIPLSGQIRIVKLHGSLPDCFPLIVTEEDYRTYPEKFAPFVNTVQQAMMETVFLLVGFSGTDPNFLNWSGWVRGKLGDASLKIYLAGWFNLSTSKRRMLEDKNVVPIDLAYHPKAAEWPEPLRHKYAIQWILYTLERGCPYNVTDWPSQRGRQYTSIPEYIQPVKEYPNRYSKKEQRTLGIKSEELFQHVKDTLDIWGHNRRLYPGWLIIPISAGYSLSLYTNEWEPKILQILPDFSLIDRLRAVHELIWRREILMDPIEPELESAAQNILALINCQARTIDGVFNDETDWTPLREAWQTIAFALVTVARHRFDHDVFEQRINALSSFFNDDPNIAHRLTHERCLWAIYSMDFEALVDLLGDWQTKECDPVWMIRKASLLCEIGQDDDAKKLIKTALNTIRGMSTEDHRLAAPSMEGWALWQCVADRQEDRQSIIKKWRDLYSLKCDALSEKEAYANKIKTENKEKKKPPFDLGMRQGDVIYFSNDEYYQYVAVWRAIRLSEIAGLPPVVDRMNVAADILKLAAEKLPASDLEMAVRLVLRVETNAEDDTLMRVLSRTRVASMSVDLAKTLAQTCDNVIKYAFPRLNDASGKRNLFWIEKMRVATEILSRLVLRLDPDMVEAILDKAMEYYGSDEFIQNRELARPLQNLLKRSWEALPEDRRSKRFFDLLGAQIAGVDNFALIRSREYDQYPDPGFLLQDDFPPPVRTDDNAERWQAIINLLVRGLRSGGGGRMRVSLRVGCPAFRDQLTETESLQIAQALWSEEYTDLNDLPGGTMFFDWVFLRLPEPEPGLAERCFRLKWLSSNDLSKEITQSPDDILWQIGNAISYLRRNGHSFSLSGNEQAFVKEMFQKWSDVPVPSDDFPLKERQLREPVYRTLSGLPILILEIALPENIGEKLYAKMRCLNQSGISGFQLVPSLVRVLPKKFDEIVLLMKTGLVSEHEDLSVNALQGLHLWLERTTDSASKLKKPPKDLVREIGFYDCRPQAWCSRTGFADCKVDIRCGT